MNVLEWWTKLAQFFDKYDLYLGWVPELCLILTGTILLQFFERRVLRRLTHKETVEKNPYLNTIAHAIGPPITFFIWFMGAMLLVNVIQKHYEIHVMLNWVDPLRKIGIIASFAWVCLRLIQKAEENLVLRRDGKKPVNKTTAIAVGRLARVVLFMIATLVVLQSLKVEVGGVITLGSAGTLVLGIAAKDMLANFFGGFMIFTDRPFSVGDWVRSPDRKIEGHVEHIGWRLTRIRTFEKQPLYVPNSVFLTISIENPSRMLNRRIREVVGLRYQDASKVPEIVAEIEEMLKTHPDLDQTHATFVAMNHFGPHSLDCLIYCFTKTTQWVPYLKVQQAVFVKITEIVKKHGADIAFPTMTVDVPEEVTSALSSVKS